MKKLSAPFSYFGSKEKVAGEIWGRLGELDVYIEPFGGSLAVLLQSPRVSKIEIVNDRNGLIVNFWRAIKYAPDEVAKYAMEPIFEVDYHAREIWLTQQMNELAARLEGDINYYDARIAGWWVWGLNLALGNKFCIPSRSWVLRDGMLIKNPAPRNISSSSDDKESPPPDTSTVGIYRQMVSVNPTKKIFRKSLGKNNRERIENIRRWFSALQKRLKSVIVLCHDWQIVADRVDLFLSDNSYRTIGIFLDPPYSTNANRHSQLYSVDDENVALEVREWAIYRGDNPRLRIALCGYDGEYTMPANWMKFQWRKRGGYSNLARGISRGKLNRQREVIWFSPHCINAIEMQMRLWQ